MSRLVLNLLGILLLLQVLTLRSKAETLVLMAVADTSLHEISPGNNMGSHTHMAAGSTAKNSPPTRSRALFRFDLAGKLPAGAELVSVKVSLRVTGVPGGGGANSTFTLHRLLRSWGEGTGTGHLGDAAATGAATWLTRSSPSSEWASPGAASGADYVAEASGNAAVAGIGDYEFGPNASLLQDVKAWLADPSSNHGWILISQSESVRQTARRFGTRESNTGASLSLEFSGGPPATPPAITSQPQDQTVIRGGNASLRVTASGSEPLRFQWHLNGAVITGATGAGLEVNNVQTADAGSYTVVVNNQAGSVTSRPAVLTVLVPPVIAEQPLSQTAILGQAVSLSVTALGSTPLQYQWQFNGQDLPGANDRTLTLDRVQLDQAGNYAVRVSNTAGNVTSITATLSVAVPPAITQQPQSQQIKAGTAAALSVTATGAPPLKYQWKFNATDLAGATNEILVMLNVQPPNAGIYTVQVSNVAGSILSSPATLTVLVPPEITQTPQSHTAVAGASASFSVAATGTSPLSYQWRFNGSPVAGATNSTLLVPSVAPAHAGGYSVVVSNEAGSITSNAAVLTVLTPPVIVEGPASQTVGAGQTLTLSVMATGSAPLSYQWQLNGNDLPGAASPSLVLQAVEPANAGNYTVRVSNTAGTVSSAEAKVIVVVPPAITRQPQSQAVPAGTTVSLSVTATGGAPLQYQWKFNDNDIPGATAETLMLSEVQASAAGRYAVAVRNPAGTILSAEAVLVVEPILELPPRIDAIQRADKNILLVLTVQATFDVAVEFSNRLPDGPWMVLTNVAAKTAPVTATVPDPIQENTARFYRLRVAGRVR